MKKTVFMLTQLRQRREESALIQYKRNTQEVEEAEKKINEIQVEINKNRYLLNKEIKHQNKKIVLKKLNIKDIRNNATAVQKIEEAHIELLEKIAEEKDNLSNARHVASSSRENWIACQIKSEKLRLFEKHKKIKNEDNEETLF